MPFKPNYNFERAERERAKQRKREEKSKRRETPGATDEAAPTTAGETPETPKEDDSHGA
jgi:hypothetical protein